MLVETTQQMSHSLADWLSGTYCCKSCRAILTIAPEYDKGVLFLRCLACWRKNVLTYYPPSIIGVLSE